MYNLVSELRPWVTPPDVIENPVEVMVMFGERLSDVSESELSGFKNPPLVIPLTVSYTVQLEVPNVDFMNT